MFLFTAATNVYASTSSVGSPNVNKGEGEFSLRSSYSLDSKQDSQDRRFRSRAHIRYNFSDLYGLQIVVSQDKRKGDSYEHDGIKIENRFHFIKSKESGFDLGVRASYNYEDGDKKPDSLEFGIFALFKNSENELRLNQIFYHDVGQDSEDGISTQTRVQYTRSLGNSYRAGVESFHDFGNLSDNLKYSEQSHSFGPVLKGKITDTTSFETGYRVGLSNEASDHIFKLFLAYSF